LLPRHLRESNPGSQINLKQHWQHPSFFADYFPIASPFEHRKPAPVVRLQGHCELQDWSVHRLWHDNLESGLRALACIELEEHDYCSQDVWAPSRLLERERGVRRRLFRSILSPSSMSTQSPGHTLGRSLIYVRLILTRLGKCRDETRVARTCAGMWMQ